MDKPKISYEDLMQAGKGCFNFHPDDDFKSVSQILEAGRESHNNLEYTCAASVFAKRLAAYIDINDFYNV